MIFEVKSLENHSMFVSTFRAYAIAKPVTSPGVHKGKRSLLANARIHNGQVLYYGHGTGVRLIILEVTESSWVWECEWDWSNVAQRHMQQYFSSRYVTAHRCPSGLKQKLDLVSGLQRHRHYVRFFDVSVQAPTWGQPFYVYSEKPQNFSRLLRRAWGYGGHILVLNPRVHTGDFKNDGDLYCLLRSPYISWNFLNDNINRSIMLPCFCISPKRKNEAGYSCPKFYRRYGDPIKPFEAPSPVCWIQF